MRCRCQGNRRACCPRFPPRRLPPEALHVRGAFPPGGFALFGGGWENRGERGLDTDTAESPSPRLCLEGLGGPGERPLTPPGGA